MAPGKKRKFFFGTGNFFFHQSLKKKIKKIKKYKKAKSDKKATSDKKNEVQKKIQKQNKKGRRPDGLSQS